MHDYRQFPPKPAVLYVNGHVYDVLVIRETRGMYQIRLAEHYPLGTAVVVHMDSPRRLRPGKTTSVPKTSVELR